MNPELNQPKKQKDDQGKADQQKKENAAKLQKEKSLKIAERSELTKEQISYLQNLCSVQWYLENPKNIDLKSIYADNLPPETKILKKDVENIMMLKDNSNAIDIERIKVRHFDQL